MVERSENLVAALILAEQIGTEIYARYREEGNISLLAAQIFIGLELAEIRKLLEKKAAPSDIDETQLAWYRRQLDT